MHGAKTAAAPASVPAIGSLEEGQINSSLLQNREDRVAPGWTWMLEVTGGNEDEVGDGQGQCSPAETMDPGWLITRQLGSRVTPGEGRRVGL